MLKFLPRIKTKQELHNLKQWTNYEKKLQKVDHISEKKSERLKKIILLDEIKEEEEDEYGSESHI